MANEPKVDWNHCVWKQEKALPAKEDIAQHVVEHLFRRYLYIALALTHCRKTARKAAAASPDSPELCADWEMFDKGWMELRARLRMARILVGHTGLMGRSSITGHRHFERCDIRSHKKGIPYAYLYKDYPRPAQIEVAADVPHVWLDKEQLINLFDALWQSLWAYNETGTVSLHVTESQDTKTLPDRCEIIIACRGAYAPPSLDLRAFSEIVSAVVADDWTGWDALGTCLCAAIVQAHRMGGYLKPVRVENGTLDFEAHVPASKVNPREVAWQQWAPQLFSGGQPAE